MIENKRMGKEVSRIIPETISEDFIIRTLSADSVVADIHSSDLFLQRVQVTDEGKNGKKLVFHYKGFRHQEVDWQVDMVLTLGERALRCLLRKAVWRTAGRLPPGKK